MFKRVTEEVFFDVEKDVEAYTDYVRSLNAEGINFDTLCAGNLIIITTVRHNKTER